MTESDKVILISRWQLRDAATAELQDTLRKLAQKVENAEEGTLVYRVHFQSRAPLDSYGKPIEPKPEPIPLELQSYVTFWEVYRDAEAFSQHVTGKVFNEFRQQTLKFFKLDPLKDGWPVTETTFFELQSGFTRNQS